MLPIIKVCGIQNANEALGAIEAGANTIGLLLGVPEYVEGSIIHYMYCFNRTL